MLIDWDQHQYFFIASKFLVDSFSQLMSDEGLYALAPISYCAIKSSSLADLLEFSNSVPIRDIPNHIDRETRNKEIRRRNSNSTRANKRA
jgi:hypothetical protein